MDTRELAGLIIKSYDENDYFTNLDEWEEIWNENYDNQNMFLDLYLEIKNSFGRTDVSKDYLDTIFDQPSDEYDRSFFYLINAEEVDWKKYAEVYKDLVDYYINYGSDVDLKMASYFLKDNKSSVSEKDNDIRNLILKTIKSRYDCYMSYDIEEFIQNWEEWKDFILDIVVLDEDNIDDIATLFLKLKCEDINEVADFYVDYSDKMAEACGKYKMQSEIAKYAHYLALDKKLKITVKDLDKNRHLGELICRYNYDKSVDEDEFDLVIVLMIDCDDSFDDEAIKILERYIQIFLSEDK